VGVLGSVFLVVFVCVWVCGCVGVCVIWLPKSLVH
jgi:hypothetical protein